MMETHRLLIIFIVYFLCAASGYPPRPLNERSPDLTWQAWLLVDDQNQNRQQQQQQQQQGNPDGTLRRRITPKSVFIAPTFSPDSFPACADGYSSDPMGRCVKIIKLDQDAHYEFLIEKLKQKFSSLDYEDEDEDEEEEIVEPTTGPLQLNIPLNIDGGDLRSEESGSETDVAIIVSPTKPGFDFKAYNFDKRDSLGDETDQEVLLKRLNEATTKTQREIGAVTAQIPTQTTAIPVPITTTTDSTTTTQELPTTTQDDPTTLYEEAATTPATTTEIETTATTTTDTSDTTTAFPHTTNIVTQSPKPDDPIEELHSMKLDLTTSPPMEKTPTISGFVKFPDDAPVSRVKFPDSHVPSSLDHIASMNDNTNERTVIVNSQRDFERSFPDGNFRKRDDHNGLFMIPPRWNPSSFQKPLVLRFSRKHAFIDKNQFNYPNYYRSIPPDDFEYLFKFKNRQ